MFDLNQLTYAFENKDFYYNVDVTNVQLDDMNDCVFGEQNMDNVIMNDFEALFVEYKKIVFVIKDRLSGFVTIRVEYISPFFVKRLADLIVFSINESMKINDIRESKNSIDFLIEQQQRTSLISLDGVFSSLIEE